MAYRDGPLQRLGWNERGRHPRERRDSAPLTRADGGGAGKGGPVRHGLLKVVDQRHLASTPTANIHVRRRIGCDCASPEIPDWERLPDYTDPLVVIRVMPCIQRRCQTQSGA